jgi:hypothetical protein
MADTVEEELYKSIRETAASLSTTSATITTSTSHNGIGNSVRGIGMSSLTTAAGPHHSSETDDGSFASNIEKSSFSGKICTSTTSDADKVKRSEFTGHMSILHPSHITPNSNNFIDMLDSKYRKLIRSAKMISIGMEYSTQKF